MNQGKKTKGRQNIEIKKIENEDDRFVAFSKRRSGIYKKASEMVTLCGAEVGVVIFSPSGKPYSFGHSSIESMANRFLKQNPPEGDNTHPLLNQQYNELVSQLEVEKERGKELQKLTKLSNQELQQTNAKLVELHKNLCNRMREKAVIGAPSSSSTFLPGNST
ncbi:agamous-like MADS-box protein AGL62 [Fagus crenata]